MDNENLKFVFWNINKNSNNIDLIVKHAKQNDIDIIVLCEVIGIKEHDISPYVLIEHIQKTNGIEVLIKPNIVANYVRELNRICILHIENNLISTMVVAHLNSDYNSTGKNYRKADIETIKNNILLEEDKYSNKNTFIVGDINENVLSDEIMDITGLCVKYFKFQMDKLVHLHEQVYEPFYDPILGLYKDNDKDDMPKGTYYYHQHELEWLCLDHVLLKKDLANQFCNDSLKILSNLNGFNLMEKNKPKEGTSDHLPIYFELKI